MAEQVAAELEDRRFDKLAYGTRLAAYINAHPQGMVDTGNAIRDTMNDVAMQANGYPSKGSRNYRPSLSEKLQAKTGNGSNTIAPPDPTIPVEPEKLRYQSTHPATDLSTYR